MELESEIIRLHFSLKKSLRTGTRKATRKLLLMIQLSLVPTCGALSCTLILLSQENPTQPTVLSRVEWHTQGRFEVGFTHTHACTSPPIPLQPSKSYGRVRIEPRCAPAASRQCPTQTIYTYPTFPCGILKSSVHAYSHTHMHTKFLALKAPTPRASHSNTIPLESKIFSPEDPTYSAKCK